MSSRKSIHSDSGSSARAMTPNTDIRRNTTTETNAASRKNESYFGSEDQNADGLITTGQSSERRNSARINSASSESESYSESEDQNSNGRNRTVNRSHCSTDSVSPKRMQKRQPQQMSQLNLSFIIIIVLVTVAAILLYHAFPQKVFKRCDFAQLRQREPMQAANVWNALSVGVEMLLNKQSDKPNVYLFIHQQGTGKKLHELINDIASETSACFDGQRHPVQMGRADFSELNGDYGYAIEQYKRKIKQGKVLLILNLNEIPALAARALHTICDTISPIAQDVVIFLTLQTSNTTAAGSAVQLATDTLYDLWGEQLQDNELDPLITRVTDTVLLLQS